jgi:hypothetical protein
MLPVTAEYRNSIYDTSRQFYARATIWMSTFGDQNPTVIDNLLGDFNGKIVGSYVANPHLYRVLSATAVGTPTAAWVERTLQINYDDLKAIGGGIEEKIGVNANERGQQLYTFDIISMLERQYGTGIWQGKTALADKRAIAVKALTSLKADWYGYGSYPVANTKFAGIRYIRDWLNGNTANANNYWNEIKVNAGTVNRAAGIAATISSGTLTNGVNITDGNTTTYAYEASGNGVAKYVQIDLGAIYTDITSIQVVHYYLDGRTFSGSKRKFHLMA